MSKKPKTAATVEIWTIENGSVGNDSLAPEETVASALHECGFIFKTSPASPSAKYDFESSVGTSHLLIITKDGMSSSTFEIVKLGENRKDVLEIGHVSHCQSLGMDPSRKILMCSGTKLIRIWDLTCRTPTKAEISRYEKPAKELEIRDPLFSVCSLSVEQIHSNIQTIVSLSSKLQSVTSSQWQKYAEKYGEGSPPAAYLEGVDGKFEEVKKSLYSVKQRLLKVKKLVIADLGEAAKKYRMRKG